MKTITRSLFISIVPLFAPLGVAAESNSKPDKIDNAIAGKGMGASWRASEVIGTTVKNAGDDTIGEVEDLMVDLKSGKILAVVISSGGFLGMADTLSSVPGSMLRYDQDAKAFKTKLTKDQLGKAPQFKKSDWPDYNDETTAAKLTAFRDSIGGDVSQPDNTARNDEEMKKDETVTPQDQGNSESDIRITTDIRKAVMGQDLSFNAKNIKIITQNGRVALRGVVESQSEHEAILKVAKNHVDAAMISDNLQVKTQ